MERLKPCPFCGAEMGIIAHGAEWNDEFVANARCWNCQSNGPTARARNEWHAKKAAIEAALRRYTPPITAETKLVCPINGAPCSECMPGSPCGVEVNKLLQKPMTLEEATSTDEAVWYEYNGSTCTEKIDCVALPEAKAYTEICTLRRDGAWLVTTECYGKTWRCWSRKPTDEERSAAEWET